MTLEEQLEGIRAIKLPRIGDVIRSVADRDLNYDEINSDYESALMTYGQLIHDKLPRIIDNISIIVQFISGLGTISSYWPNSIEDREQFDPEIFYPRFFSYFLESGDFYMAVTRSDDETIELFFDKDDFSLKDLCLSQKNLKREKNQSVYVRESFLRFDNAESFTNAYIDFVLNDLRRNGESRYTIFPIVLNRVPSVIERLYQMRVTEKERRLDSLKNLGSNLEKVEVPKGLIFE